MNRRFSEKNKKNNLKEEENNFHDKVCDLRRAILKRSLGKQKKFFFFFERIVCFFYSLSLVKNNCPADSSPRFRLDEDNPHGRRLS